MERVILATLRWDTAAVTPQDFLPHFLASVEQRGGGDSDEPEEEQLSTLRRHSDTLAAMCACDSRFLGAPPSLVAAASLNCALRGLGNKGPSQLVLTSEALAELCQTDLVSKPTKLMVEIRPIYLILCHLNGFVVLVLVSCWSFEICSFEEHLHFIVRPNAR